MSAGHQHKEEESGDHNRLIPVAWTILVMGISLAVVILLYVSIGHIGPIFSRDTLQKQQQELRQQQECNFLFHLLLDYLLVVLSSLSCLHKQGYNNQDSYKVRYVKLFLKDNVIFAGLLVSQSVQQENNLHLC